MTLRLRITDHLRRTALACAATLILALASPARADDAAREWSPLSNNAGARWTYGWKPTMQGAFTLHPNAFTDAQGVQHWRASASATVAAAMFNPTVAPRTAVPYGGGSR